VADGRQLALAPGRPLRTRLAGVFLFLPLLARLGFDALVAQAGYPGSRLIPAPSALLSLLSLKLLDKERRSHIDDFNFDAALGLFAGLNVLPKKTVLSVNFLILSHPGDSQAVRRRSAERLKGGGSPATMAGMTKPVAGHRPKESLHVRH